MQRIAMKIFRNLGESIKLGKYFELIEPDAIYTN